MRKILLSSIILILFSVSISIFQLSCKKDVQAQSGSSYVLSPATTTKLGGVIPDGTTISVDANGKISAINTKNILLFSIMDFNNSDAVEIWLSNLDGSNKRKIPISVPQGFLLSSDAQLTPDAENVIFSMYSTSSPRISHIYRCKIDGTQLTKIHDGVSSPDKVFIVNGTY